QGDARSISIKLPTARCPARGARALRLEGEVTLLTASGVEKPRAIKTSFAEGTRLEKDLPTPITIVEAGTGSFAGGRFHLLLKCRGSARRWFRSFKVLDSDGKDVACETRFGGDDTTVDWDRPGFCYLLLAKEVASGQ